MNTKDIHTFVCESEDQIVMYLYGESTPAQRAEFESHMLQCTGCTDEFAEMSNARYSVYEWQREEFAPLATPKFAIPYEPKVTASWAEAIRSIVSFEWPAYAMAAVLILALSGIGIWNLRPAADQGPTGPDISSNIQSRATLPPQSQIPPAADRNIESESVQNSARSEPVSKYAVKAPKAVSLRPRKARGPEDQIQKMVRGAEVASSIRRGPPLPTLTAAVDDEDRSLRLSDLFESVDR